MSEENLSLFRFASSLLDGSSVAIGITNSCSHPQSVGDNSPFVYKKLLHFWILEPQEGLVLRIMSSLL